jgi:hypothetical protein
MLLKNSGAIRSQRGASSTLLVVIICILLSGLAGFGGYFIADSKDKSVISDRDETIKALKKDANPSQGLQQTPNPLGSAAPQVEGGSAAQTVNFTSASLGFTLNVPQSWVGKWHYHENGEIGISTASVSFYLLDKKTKYAEVVTVAKIPQAKYDDAKGQNQPIANPDNFLQSAGGNAYVMAFPDGQPPDLKDFTYAQAAKDAKAAFKASFKPL